MLEFKLIIPKVPALSVDEFLRQNQSPENFKIMTAWK
jgi:hypothetical protein